MMPMSNIVNEVLSMINDLSLSLPRLRSYESKPIRGNDLLIYTCSQLLPPNPHRESSLSILNVSHETVLTFIKGHSCTEADQNLTKTSKERSVVSVQCPGQ